MSHKVFYRLASLFLALAISFAELGSALAAAGALDPTFDTDGIVITPIASGPADDHGNAVAVQPDGKIVVAGTSDQGLTSFDFALARYNSDGSLDTSFDTDGIVTTDFGNSVDSANAIALQADGKIVAAGDGGSGDFVLARYNTDGSLDTAFDTDGKVTTDFGGGSDLGLAVAIQGDGKIVVGGRTSNGLDFDFALARYNNNGSLDTSFDTDGMVINDFGNNDTGWAVAIQGDGKIVQAGDSGFGATADFALARYNTNGSLDTGFDTDGRVTTDIAGGNDRGAGIAVQPDNKIVVAGTASSDFALARYNSNGSLDATFDTDGKVNTDFNTSLDLGNAVVLQLDGKIVVAGGSDGGGSGSLDFGLARYNPDGSLDTTFGTDGKVTTAFNITFFDIAKAVVVQPDGKIVAAGTSPQTGTDFDFAVARYDAGTSALGMTIDVKPGKFPNRIELENNVCKDDDNLYVAILTTPAFDALTVDASSLQLGDPLLGGTAAPVRSRAKDVDLDGDLDMALAFPLCDLVTNMALDSSSTELVLTGMTLGSVTVTGTDSVAIQEDDD